MDMAMTGGAVSVSLLSVLGLLLFIGWKGLSYFWPSLYINGPISKAR